MPDTNTGVQLAMHAPRVVTTAKKAKTRARVTLPRHYSDVRLRILSAATVYLELADVPDGSLLEGDSFETITPVGVPVYRVVRRGEFAVSTDKGNAAVELTAEPYTGRE